MVSPDPPRGPAIGTRQLLQEEILDKLRHAIEGERSDRLVRISSERELAASLGVSRLSLRKAMKQFVDEGLLIQKQGSGTYIVPRIGIDSVHVFVAPDIKPNDPFYQDFISTFSRLAGRESIKLHVIDEEHAASAPTSTPLILVGIAHQATVLALKERYRHIISVTSYPHSLDIAQVYFDDYRIGRQAGRILQSNNHKRLVHVCGPNTFPSAAERRRGFNDSLTQSGVTAEFIEAKMNWKGGYALGEAICELVGGRYGASGLFAANDWQALGLIRRVTELGVRVPEDLSVIGCDDIHLATEIHPHLSTFRLDMDLLVRELLQLLKTQVSSNTLSDKRVLLPVGFIQRDSLIARPE